MFDDDAYDVIYRYSGGVPRLINTLCDSALLGAFAEGKYMVNADDIQATAEELNWKEHEGNTGRFNQLQHVSGQLVERTDMTQIEVRTDGELVSMQSFPMGRIIIGRSPDNEVFIKGKFVSRHHAQIVTDEEGCIIEDLNSTNGVFIGEKQIKRYRLRDGDVISLGAHEIVYTDLRCNEPANEANIPEDLAVEIGGDDEPTAVGG